MKNDIYKIGDFIFTKIDAGVYYVFHPFWDFKSRYENGKLIIRLIAKP